MTALISIRWLKPLGAMVGLMISHTGLLAYGDAVIAFKTTPTRTLYLHHYRPVDWQASQLNPAIVFFHGGGWQSPNINQFEWQAEHYRNRGLVAILVEYRVGSVDGTTVESAILDARSAMRHVKANAGSYGIDAARVIAAGGSAGGHLALGCSMFNSYPPEPGDPPGINPAPVATITFNPVVDTTAPDGFGTGYFSSNPALGSPSDLVSSNLPPCLVMHGTSDSTIPFQQASSFVQSMKNAGNDCELVAYSGQGHGFFNGEPYRSMTIAQADAFLETRVITGSLALTGYERWRYAAFGISGNAGPGADLLDPDHDGLATVLDYALGGQAMRNDATLASLNPQLLSGTVKLSFGHRPDPHLRLNLLRSSDLVTWNAVGEWNGTAWSGSATFKSSLDGERLLIEARMPSQPGTKEFWKLGARHAPDLP
jgi:acetyl esterase/lipase